VDSDPVFNNVQIVGLMEMAVGGFLKKMAVYGADLGLVCVQLVQFGSEDMLSYTAVSSLICPMTLFIAKSPQDQPLVNQESSNS
jgi:hypothetical protein